MIKKERNEREEGQKYITHILKVLNSCETIEQLGLVYNWGMEIIDRTFPYESYLRDYNYEYCELLRHYNYEYCELLKDRYKNKKSTINTSTNIINKFYKEVNDWLLPIGFVEVFSNHPDLQIREFHFSKDGVRVVCVINLVNKETYCYLQNDILMLPYPMAIKTGHFKIGSEDVEKVFELIKIKSSKILL